MMLPTPNTTESIKGVGTLNGPANADLFADVPDVLKDTASAISGGYDMFSDVKNAPVSAAYDLTRSFGTGIRSGLEGMAGIPGDVAWLYRWAHDKIRGGMGYEKDPNYVAGTGDYTGKSVFGELPTSADARTASTAFIGDAYKPQSTPGKYAETIGEFAVPSLGGRGKVLANLAKYAVVPGAISEAMGQTTAGTEYEPYARVAGGLLSGMGTAAMSGKAFPTKASRARKAVVEAANRQGVPLPHVAVGDTPVQSLLGAKIAQMPVIGSPLANASQNTITAMGNRVGFLAGPCGVNKESAAQCAKEALSKWIGPGADSINDAAYARVDRHVNPNVSLPLYNTRAMVSQMLREADASTSTSARSAIDLVAEATNRNNGLNYEGLKTLRTDIGARLSGKITPEPGTSQPALKRLYGALSEDLKNTVATAGGSRGLAAFERANATARAVAAQRENLARVLGKKGDATPNAVIDGIKALASNKHGGSAERLTQVRDVLQNSAPTANKAWYDVKSALLADLGHDPSSPTNVFSPERFFTAYGKFSDSGKSILFGATRKHLDDLALISERHRAITRIGNPSGTGGVVTTGSVLTGATLAPLSTAATISGTYALARIMARKASAEKLATWAKARNGILRGSGTIAVQANILASRDLAQEISKETGKPEREVFNALMSGKTSDVGAGMSSDADSAEGTTTQEENQ